MAGFLALGWADISKIPYNVCGPYLTELFNRAFIHGLHNPQQRPNADEWEQALIKTVDLMQPCQNSNCEQKWYVFANTTKPCCPFCGTEYKGQLPIINLYSKTPTGKFSYENRRLMVYSGQNIYQWHINKNIFPNEKLTIEEKKPVSDFHFTNNKWILVNRALPSMVDKDTDTPIEIGKSVDIIDGKKILFSNLRLLSIKSLMTFTDVAILDDTIIEGAMGTSFTKSLKETPRECWDKLHALSVEVFHQLFPDDEETCL